MTPGQLAAVSYPARYAGRDCDLMDSSIDTMMHGFRGFFRFAHIDGPIPPDPAVYVRLPKIHSDESGPRGWTGSS
ncbi:MAG: hypothetical protein M3P83_04100 [Actinomycetota bacterium]|nr:hypothetical protein [Actinomycetota bacterium]